LALGVILSRRSAAKDPGIESKLAFTKKPEVRSQKPEFRIEKGIAGVRWVSFLTSEFWFLTSDFFLTLLPSTRPDSTRGPSPRFAGSG
jgi:hypothetical protein